MPGLSIAYRATGATLPARERWLRALEASRGDAPSRRVSHLEDDCCRVGSDAHEHYPIDTREDGPIFMALEGRIYGASRAPMDELTALARGLMGGADDGAAAIRSRIHQWEGEYVAVVYSKPDRRLWVF